MNRNVRDIVEEVLSGMDMAIEVYEVEDLGSDTWKLKTYKTFTATIGKTITDANDVEYVVTDISNDSFLTVSSEDEPPVGDYSVEDVVFHAGTPKAVNAERSLKAKNTRQRMYPALWFLEVMTERLDRNALSTVHSIPTCRMFFLDEARIQSWTTQDHHDYVVQPMVNLLEAFLLACENDDRIGSPSAFEWNIKMIRHANFALNFVNYKSNDQFNHISASLNEHVSGVELRIDLPVLKSCN